MKVLGDVLLGMLAALFLTAGAAFVLFIFVLGPLAGLWALNTLFGLGIAYTWKTWLAAFVLIVLVKSRTKVTTEKAEKS